MSTPNLNLDHITGSQNNKETTANAAFDGLDNAMNSVLSKAITGNDFLTVSELRSYGVVVLTGTPGSPFELELPAEIERVIHVVNTTDSTVTVVGADTGSGTVVVNSSSSSVIFTDGVAIYGIAGASSGGVPAGTISVEDDGSTVDADADTLNFTGSGVTVTDSGGGTVEVAISGGGGGGSITWRTESTSTDLTDSDMDGAHGVSMDSASATTITVPAGLTVTGSVALFREGTGDVTIDAESGVTIYSADNAFDMRVQYSFATLTQLSSDVYILAGDLTA